MSLNNTVMNTLAIMAQANDEYPRARLAAALVKNNKIISFGINRKKTDPLQAKFGKNKDAIYLHAEIHAIKNALRDYTYSDIVGAKLYVCRVKRPSETSKKWTWGMARPCEGCARAIVEFGISNVVYSIDKMGCYEVIL